MVWFSFLVLFLPRSLVSFFVPLGSFASVLCMKRWGGDTATPLPCLFSPFSPVHCAITQPHTLHSPSPTVAHTYSRPHHHPLHPNTTRPNIIIYTLHTLAHPPSTHQPIHPSYTRDDDGGGGGGRICARAAVRSCGDSGTVSSRGACVATRRATPSPASCVRGLATNW